ncbi:MAG: indolepyruvate ferredoxin oxidoreductase family protein, partial [Ideonella sp.]|nr:indolepyruvate ferredoxin oxidoreductase family protein [Ideonella sp.]
MTGVQALVRLPLQQRLRDAALGSNTGGYVSGYRGSPLGRYDTELWAAQEALAAAGVVFRAGLNEDLAATAIWGAQHVGNFPGAKVDGVFGIWYGKGPGVDRSGDVLRHGNLAGASSRGGVLCMAGDDHGAKSSTVANFSDPIFIAVGMPVLYPSNTQELLDFGLHGIAMSRHSGCWVGMKVVTDVVEGGGSVRVSPDLPHIVVPPAAGPELSIRVADPALAQEQRLYHHKLPAALAYARANELNRITLGNGRASVGIVAAGKAWQDVLQAMGELGIGDDRAEALGLRLLKIGMVWPLDPQIVRQFAAELQTILVVEEKRPILEDQLRAILFDAADRPTVIGKHRGAAGFDAQPGPVVFPNAGEISPAQVAQVLCSLLGLQGRGAFAPPAPASGAPTPVRMPGFCSGCPHNRSTKVPHGSRALAGIGCHAMATLIDPAHTNSISHMGGEGVMWLGQQPFTQERHVFANLGDGTFSHSGHLAVRQAVAAHVPITYKLLYNGFVSMTGGQPVESGMSPVAMLRVLDAEGVRKMAVVTDDPGRYEGLSLPEGV